MIGLSQQFSKLINHFIYLNCMEKSMVQELSSLTHSTIFSSRPSFIFPSDPDRLELRKSRIQNLPGYRKDDLSGKLNFIVVFQTIEIERLTQQIETLRIMAKDWQRQRLNYQNYEVQIRELTERCHSYELQREGIEDELQRMRDFCDKLMNQVQESRLKSRDYEPGLKEKYQLERARNEQLQVEVDRWRNRYSSLQSSRTKQLQEMRGELETKRRSQISRQTRQLAIKYQNEVAGLNSELRKMREDSTMKLGEISRLQQIICKFQFREEEMREIEQKMYEYQNKFVMLSQENYRLNELLRKKADDIDRMRRSEKEIKTKIQATSVKQEQIKALQTQLETTRHSYEELERNCRSISEHNQKLALQCEKAQGYGKLMDELEGEVQRLNQLMRERIGQCDQLKNINKTMESKLIGMSSATQKEFANYEERIISFTREQERQNAQLKHRLSENEQLKVRCSDLQKEVGTVSQLRHENQSLRGQLGQFSNKMQELKRKIKLLEQNLALMQQIQKKLKTEERIKKDLLADQQRLNASIRELTLQLQTSQQKVVSLQQEVTQLSNSEEEKREWKNRFAWMTQELDRLNAEIQARVGEIQQLKQNYRSLSSSKANYQSIEQRLVQNLSQMEQLILELDSTRRQNDRLQNDNMNMEVAIRGLQGQVIGLIEQRDDRNRVFNAQNMEIKQMRQQVEVYLNQNRAKQQIEQNLQEQSKKVESMKGLVSQLQERLNKQTDKNESLAMELMQMRSQPKMSKQLSQQITLVRKQGEQHRTIINVLLQRISKMENILMHVKQGYSASIQQANIYRERLNMLSVKSDCINELSTIFNSFSDKIDNLREQNLKLQTEKALSGIQYCESMKVLQENTVVIPQQTIIKNSSIAFKLSAQQIAFKVQEDRDLFTFKDVNRERTVLASRDEINERIEQQNDDGRESASMASSFINTLLTKESVKRFQPREATDNTAFGYNIHSKQRNHSPQQYQTRYQREEFLPNQPQIQNIPTQINRAVSPVHRASFFENAGIKRVTSYTHFAPSFQSQLSPSQDIAPIIRVQQVHRSPNTVNSTNESCSQLGKRIRIPADPARLLIYRQQ